MGEARCWLVEGCKPDWDAVQGASPALKAYCQQYPSLCLKSGVLYRRLEPAQPRGEVGWQLLLPRTLREPLLRAIHEGVSGHLGALKTRAHVGRRAYWFKWRAETDNFCKVCNPCNEYYHCRVAPRQGRLEASTMGAPVERWACDLAGHSPSPCRASCTSSRPSASSPSTWSLSR